MSHFSALFWGIKLVLKLSSGTINSKINGTPKGVYMPISKLHSILAVANLLAYNNVWLRASKLATTKKECSFEMGKLTPFGVLFNLLLTVHFVRISFLVAGFTFKCIFFNIPSLDYRQLPKDYGDVRSSQSPSSGASFLITGVRACHVRVGP